MIYTEVLILVAGTTPQIITETIYALSKKSPPIYPAEIYIITTSAGKKRINDTLIKKGILRKLIKEHNLPKTELSEELFIVVRNASGNEIDDIRDEVQNEVMGDLIATVIQEKTKDPAVRLHCSLAGGRKTMSFYMGSAMQIFGRPWDKLYHVLVTPEFETNHAFFYKPLRNKVIECRLPDGTVKRLNTKDAEILLAELSFIRLRDKLSPPLQSKSFRELIAEGQKEIDIATVQSEMIVNLLARVIYVGNVQVRLTPVQLMTYTAFIRQKTDYCRRPERQYCIECTDCFKTLMELKRNFIENMADDYRTIYPSRAEEWLSKWSKEVGLIDTMRQNISKINSTLKRLLDKETLRPYYTITSLRKYGDTRYGIRAEKGKIKVV